MRTPDLTISDFQDYKIETLYARDKNKEMFIITSSEKGTITYRVNNRRGDWGNYEGDSLSDAIAAYNEL